MTDDIPFPALLNTRKHHAAWIREYIAITVRGGPEAVARLPRAMVVIGTRLMDLYTGTLTLTEITEYVFADLKGRDLFEFPSLAKWLTERGEYAIIELPDTSKWTIRLGPADGRYLHLHPGRWSSHTMRVQANTIKSAVMAHAHAQLTGRDPTNLEVVNEAGKLYLDLLPVREITADSGLGTVIAMLGRAENRKFK